MSPTVTLPVRLRSADFEDVDAIAVECPVCFLLVREVKLDDHKAASHA
jgi:hypothetical protein